MVRGFKRPRLKGGSTPEPSLASTAASTKSRLQCFAASLRGPPDGASCKLKLPSSSTLPREQPTPHGPGQVEHHKHREPHRGMEDSSIARSVNPDSSDLDRGPDTRTQTPSPATQEPVPISEKHIVCNPGLGISPSTFTLIS